MSFKFGQALVWTAILVPFYAIFAEAEGSEGFTPLPSLGDFAASLRNTAQPADRLRKTSNDVANFAAQFKLPEDPLEDVTEALNPYSLQLETSDTVRIPRAEPSHLSSGSTTPLPRLYRDYRSKFDFENTAFPFSRTSRPVNYFNLNYSLDADANGEASGVLAADSFVEATPELKTHLDQSEAINQVSDSVVEDSPSDELKRKLEAIQDTRQRMTEINFAQKRISKEVEGDSVNELNVDISKILVLRQVLRDIKPGEDEKMSHQLKTLEKSLNELHVKALRIGERSSPFLGHMIDDSEGSSYAVMKKKLDNFKSPSEKLESMRESQVKIKEAYSRDPQVSAATAGEIRALRHAFLDSERSPEQRADPEYHAAANLFGEELDTLINKIQGDTERSQASSGGVAVASEQVADPFIFDDIANAALADPFDMRAIVAELKQKESEGLKKESPADLPDAKTKVTRDPKSVGYAGMKEVLDGKIGELAKLAEIEREQGLIKKHYRGGYDDSEYMEGNLEAMNEALLQMRVAPMSDDPGKVLPEIEKLEPQVQALTTEVKAYNLEKQNKKEEPAPVAVVEPVAPVAVIAARAERPIPPSPTLTTAVSRDAKKNNSAGAQVSAEEKPSKRQEPEKRRWLTHTPTKGGATLLMFGSNAQKSPDQNDSAKNIRDAVNHFETKAD